MFARTGLRAALILAMGLAGAAPAAAQDRTGWDDERMREAMVRMEEALERARDQLDPERVRAMTERVEAALERARDQMDPERMRAMTARMEEALERVRAELAEVHLDTIRVFRGEIRRALDPAPLLGLRFGTEAVADHPGGVRLSGVIPGSAAQEAGLRSGDIVVEVGGHDLARALPDERLDDRERSPALQRLRALTGDLEEGDTVRVVYLRDGARRTVTLEARRLSPWGSFGFAGDTILVWPHGGRPPQLQWDFPGLMTPGAMALGLRLMDLNPELGAYFGRDEGVLVLEVRDDAPLAFRAGDVLLRIDGREVEDSRHAQSILRSYRSGERIRVEVLRQGREEGVEGRVP